MRVTERLRESLPPKVASHIEVLRGRVEALEAALGKSEATVRNQQAHIAALKRELAARTAEGIEARSAGTGNTDPARRVRAGNRARKPL